MNAITRAALTAEDILADEASSLWIRSALTAALERDPIDVLNDALILAAVLEVRLREVLELEEAT